MATVTEIGLAVLDGIVRAGVPWWGWIALLAMIFWGLLVPSGEDGNPTPRRDR